MRKLWICLFLLSAAVNAQQDDDSYPADWDDLDLYSDLSDELNILGGADGENLNPDPNKDTQLSPEDKNKKEYDQIEDNRSAQIPDEIQEGLVKSDEIKNEEPLKSGEAVNSEKSAELARDIGVDEDIVDAKSEEEKEDDDASVLMDKPDDTFINKDKKAAQDIELKVQEDEEDIMDQDQYSDLLDEINPLAVPIEADVGQKKDSRFSSEYKNLKEDFDQIEDNRSAQIPDELDSGLAVKSDVVDSENENADDKLRNEDPVKASESDVIKNDETAKVNSEEKKEDDDASVFMDEQSVEDTGFQEEKEDIPVEPKDTNIEDIIEETKQILEETDDNFEVNNEKDNANDDDNDETNDKYAEEAAADILESAKDGLLEEDTVDKVYQDLNEDLDKLMETWKKLNDENGDYVEPEKNADDALSSHEVFEYEDKYGVPYGEKYILSLREQDFNNDNADEKMSDEADDDDVEDKALDALVQAIDEENVKTSNNTRITAKYTDDDQGSNVGKDENKNNYDDDLFKDDPEADDATSEEDDSNEDDIVKNDHENGSILIEAVEDAFHDDDSVKNVDEMANESVVPKAMLRDEIVSKTEKQSTVSDIETLLTANSDLINDGVTSIDVSKLTSQQYDQLMEQFVQAHADDFDITKFDAGRNVAPIHVTLTQEPTLITSPNHPRPYPSNNIIDWMFTGDGTGIELVIHDFYVNGISGDYVLIKPGGIDASGQEGLVFSHMLNEPRRYRFLDVNQMFVRFEARPGLSFRPGFSFSVRMVSPPSEDSEEEESLPEPEAIGPVPAETYTILIGGLTLPQFNESAEEFRHIIADMATLYINSNGIDPGLNTTLQVTQITNVAVCNLNWPNSDRCAEVSVAVPLVYDDEDKKPRLAEKELRAMWYLYSNEDPFALRLRRLDMEEFMSPNDSGVLTVWLVIGFGLLISMAMLAFALWRFSCFENYSRMPTYSDRDSVYSGKQGLDLYPTPHQTLPPLFSENEYKWEDAKYEDSTRVDMGGFTNKSYARDELFDIDSDEDVISPTKRDSGNQPRGFEV